MIETLRGYARFDRASIPLLLLTLALVVNFFWRAHLFTGNNLPPVVILSLIMVVVWFVDVRSLTAALRLRWTAGIIPLAVYVFAVALSVLVRGDFGLRTIELVLRAGVLLVMAVVVSNTVQSLWSIEGAVYLLIAGFTAAALYGFAEYLIHGSYYLDIFSGISRKNASGYYFMSILPFIFFSLRSPHVSRFGKWLLGAALVICFAAMLLTLARSAVVGLLAGLFAVFVLYGRRLNWKLIVAILVLVAGSLVFAPPSVRYRLGTTFNFQQKYASSNSSRLILLKAGWRMAEEHPWVGIGVGRFDENLNAYITPEERALLGYSTYEASHNQYVTVLDEGGILALFGVLWLLAQMLWELHRRLERPGLPRRYLFLAFAAFWWSQVAHFFVEWQMSRELFWFMVGLTGAALWLTRERVEVKG